jgi:hypothetical protein
VKYYFQVVVGLLIFAIQGSLSFSESDSTKTRSSIEAVRIINPVVVDGILSEMDWQRPGTSQFTQRDPNEAAQPTQKTEVWVAYDDAALYIAARCYDTNPDSIISRVGRRDASLTTDAFYVGIDSYHDRRSGYCFTVASSGSIIDGTLSNDTWEDDSWDGVWDAATHVDEKGWTVEMKIPYSQLRFPEQTEYVWGINFLRIIARSNERDYFVMVPKKESGWISRFADLTGLRDIHPPRTLEIAPYFASSGKFTQHDAGDPFNSGHKYDQNFGADIKYGLGSNLTLNATINPDFGQVEVDPAVVNLTQYETYYNEKRPFFVEGSSFFDFGYGGANNNWGPGYPDYFYSRRVGRPPQGSVQHEGFADLPDRTHILGAAKLTGKVADGWSLGAVQAVTAREYGKTDSSGVRFSDVVEPLSYYGVVRSLREFNEGNQGIGFISTLGLRDLSENYLRDNFNRESFAFGADGWTNLDSNKIWVINGWLSATHVEGSSTRILTLQQNPYHYYQRPDIDYVNIDSTKTSLNGYSGRVAVNKQNGNTFLNAAVGFVTPGFDSNDLGTMYNRGDVLNSHLILGYRWYEPDGVFRRKTIYLQNISVFTCGTSLSSSRYRTGNVYFLFLNSQFMNFWGINNCFGYRPGSYDVSRTRGGPMMKATRNFDWQMNAYSDTRQTIEYYLYLYLSRSESGSYDVSWSPEIVWKLASGLNIDISPSIYHGRDMAQWVTKQDDPLAKETYGSRYVFSTLEQTELSASIRAGWTFTPKLSLQLYLQPLISIGTYNDFKELKQPSTFTFNHYGIDNGSTSNFDPVANQYTVDPDGSGLAQSFVIDNPNFNFKSLRGNAVLRWEYMPGSTLYFVWTQQRSSVQDPGDFSLGRDFRNLFSGVGDNVFMVKATYWWNP